MRILLFLVMTLMSTMAGAAPAKKEVPPMENPALSPDGRYLAYLLRDIAGNAAVELLDLDRDDAHRRVLDAGAIEAGVVIDRCGWGNSERLLCGFRGRTNAAVSGLFAVNADGSGPRMLVRQVRAGGDERTRPEVIGWERDDLRSVLIALHASGEDYPSVQRLDLYTGALELLLPAQAPIQNFILDGYGEVRFGWGQAPDGTSAAFSRLGKARLWRGLKWQRLTRFAPASGPNVLRPLKGDVYLGDSVSAVGRDAGGDAIWHIDVNDRTDPQRMRAGNGECRPIVSPRGRLLGLEFPQDAERRWWWMDGRSDNVIGCVAAQLPDAEITMLDYVDNPSRFILQASPRGKTKASPRVYLYRIAGGPFELRELGKIERASTLQEAPKAVASKQPLGPAADDLDLLITIVDPATKKPVTGLPLRVVLSSDPDWQAPDAGKRYVTDDRGRVRDTRQVRMESRRVGLDIPLVTHAAAGFEIGIQIGTAGMPLLYTLTLDEVKKAHGTLISDTQVYTRAADGTFSKEVDLTWNATNNETQDVYTLPPRDAKTFERLPDPPPFRITERNLQLLPHPKADGSTRWALDLRLTLDPYRPREGG
jgi:hypothetical protein